MHILGIETSCDETAAAVLGGGGRVLSSLVHSQVARHRPYGGVVPEIASRSHVEELPGMLEEARAAARIAWADLDAIAVTRGPGLASSLLVGLVAAKALALRLGKPLVGVNHIEAHLHSIFLGEDAPRPGAICPLVVLMVSGGHTCLVRMDDENTFRLLGQTLDDAAGEALDKGASLLRLGYPGGPAIEETAQGGDPAYVKFPRGMERAGSARVGGLDRDLCFSYSGVKTALRYYVRDHADLFTDGTLKDVAASYQEAVFEALMERTRRALDRERVGCLACVGGVARNRRLRDKLQALAARRGVALRLAPPAYCTDNAAMVAARGLALFDRGQTSPMDMDIDPNLGIGRVVG
ncbi:MAG: tRNA (adenosine(37)-N6)-threonylcarbamoyltransferase complex transferase subunit TsaD [Kiritimatiellae bacterium]|nr:tRNA (adenosine(37)-N6)-threonylcarbamoyltransferase complex transferase subunit TsaD [Kiritimatiellia bacterium]